MLYYLIALRRKLLKPIIKYFKFSILNIKFSSISATLLCGPLMAGLGLADSYSDLAELLGCSDTTLSYRTIQLSLNFSYVPISLSFQSKTFYFSFPVNYFPKY